MYDMCYIQQEKPNSIRIFPYRLCATSGGLWNKNPKKSLAALNCSVLVIRRGWALKLEALRAASQETCEMQGYHGTSKNSHTTTERGTSLTNAGRPKHSPKKSSIPIIHLSEGPLCNQTGHSDSFNCGICLPAFVQFTFNTGFLSISCFHLAVVESVKSYLGWFSWGQFRASGTQEHGGLMSTWAAWLSQCVSLYVWERMGRKRRREEIKADSKESN